MKFTTRTRSYGDQCKRRTRLRRSSAARAKSATISRSGAARARLPRLPRGRAATRAREGRSRALSHEIRGASIARAREAPCTAGPTRAPWSRASTPTPRSRFVTASSDAFLFLFSSRGRARCRRRTAARAGASRARRSRSRPRRSLKRCRGGVERRSAFTTPTRSYGDQCIERTEVVAPVDAQREDLFRASRVQELSVQQDVLLAPERDATRRIDDRGEVAGRERAIAALKALLLAPLVPRGVAIPPARLASRAEVRDDRGGARRSDAVAAARGRGRGR
eukprot:30550-Pelagococcus_subviridis.AAC.2